MSDRSRLRLAVLRILVLSLFVTLLGRLWFLQVMAGDRYAAIAKSNRVRPVITAAPRGRILDAVGRELVRNRTVTVVTVDRTALDREPHDGAEVITRLSEVLGMSAPEIRARIAPCGTKPDPKLPPPPDVPCWNGSPFQPVPVMADVPDEVAFRIEEHAEDFPGIEATLQAVRSYPNKSLAAHLLGYISPVTEAELAKKDDPDLQRTDLTGRAGLEQSYDDDLRGRSGVKQFLVDSRGRVTGLAADTPAESGNDLVTTIDAPAQRVLETALENAVMKARSTIDERGNKLPFKAPSAAGVIMEVATGAIVGDGELSDVRPGAVHRRHQQGRLRGAQRQGGRRTADLPRDTGALRAGVDVQDREHVDGGQPGGEPVRQLRLPWAAAGSAGCSATSTAARSGGSACTPRW